MTKNKLLNKYKTGVWRVSFSQTGAIGATVFFALSLTPSLLPRGWFFQGLMSGITAAIGYALGMLLERTYNYLQLPKPSPKQSQQLLKIMTSAALITTLVSLWSFIGSQNNVRELIGVDDRLNVAVMLPMLLISALSSYLTIVLFRSFATWWRWTNRQVCKVMPQRLAKVISSAALVLIIINLFNGVILNTTLKAANSAFSKADQTTDSWVKPTSLPQRSGSEDSKSTWDSLGRQGRRFVSTGPSKDEISQFTGSDAKQPVRVYVGKQSAGSIQDRADLALEELKRTKAFDRKILLVTSTTGTGWLDPNSIEPLEYMHGGDTAIVGMQYSYLPSWISIFADGKNVKDTSRALFRTVHSY